MNYQTEFIVCLPPSSNLCRLNAHFTDCGDRFNEYRVQGCLILPPSQGSIECLPAVNKWTDRMQHSPCVNTSALALWCEKTFLHTLPRAHTTN